MAVYFRRGEVFRAAMEMEKAGLAFYRAVATQTTEESTRAVFTYLATAERRHLQRFRGLWTKHKGGGPGGSGPEYNRYLRALLSDRVFPSSAAARSRAARSGVRVALDTGIKAEKDSIIFYVEMVDGVSPEDRVMVEKVLADEKRHLQRLLNYKERSRCA